ncbi:asparagine synthetase B [glutamine-hydrolyzing] [archaeon BMS3Abin16]|nr:asparagine synthetase B [glutamine-hydrolyzing] [archaeon BMS3Abin16]
MNYVEKLDAALEAAVRKSINDTHSLGLLFSGGLDSSLLAKICADIGVQPTLVSVYMEGSRDESVARDAASFFDLEHVEKVIFEDEIEAYVKHVSEAASTGDILDISIGVPLYAGLETASFAGLESVMCGQGADELFAGYHRYLNMEVEQLESELKKDVETINIARDRSIASAHGIMLLTPYLDESVVELGLQIPVSLKIKSGVRKYVLREVAKNRGLPKSIWSREKKAIQYSTGVDKRVKKIIKKGV